jgi:TetR/AcrR family transcriptional regulator, acrEF/envCD operon repressor
VARVPATQRRDDLVQAAIRVATRDGLAAATTRRIAREAGVSVGIVHYCFRSKEELLGEVVRVLALEGYTAAAEALPAEGDAEELIGAAVHAFWTLIEATPERQLLTYEVITWALRTPEIEPIAREQRDRQIDGIRQLMTLIAEAARIEWIRPVDDLARMVLNITDGVVLSWLVDRDSDAAVRSLDAFVGQFAAYTKKSTHKRKAG